MADRLLIRSCVHALLIVISMHAVACRARTESISVERHFDALNRMEKVTANLPDKARAAVIGAAYNELLSSVRAIKPLDSANDHELDLLYKAARLTAFYTLDGEHVRDMASFLDGLERRGLATKSHHVQMYEVLIKTRMLAEARELARRHPLPELEPLPALHEAADLVAGQPTEWAVDPDRHALLRRSVDLHRPAQVVIVSHPSCHFSQAAMQDIQADSVLGEVFREHARWLAPQGAHLYFDVVQRWNREHPEREITLTFQREEWPMIDSWGTPTFYFLKDGVVRAKVEGWPKGGRRPELLAALRQVGLVQ
jgi:hypothetical protein